VLQAQAALDRCLYTRARAGIPSPPRPSLEPTHRAGAQDRTEIHDGLSIVRHAHPGRMGFSQFPQPLRDRGLARPALDGMVWYIEINADPEGEAPRQGSSYRSNAEKGSHSDVRTHFVNWRVGTS
jgi:hypothetical protein